MNDKERILTHIISYYYPKYLLNMGDATDKINNCVSENIKIGDLVLACTSGIHEFTVGYVVHIKSESEMTIREIGSQKTCNISNEMFYKINKEHLSKYYLLEGLEYEVYLKVIKAINKATSYATRFHSLDFDGNKCTINLRLMFEQNITKTYTFAYSNKTTIKEIVKLIKDE